LCYQLASDFAHTHTTITTQLSPELLQLVTDRSSLSEKSDVLLLSIENTGEDYQKPSLPAIQDLSSFIPSWMSLPLIEMMVKRHAARRQARLSISAAVGAKDMPGVQDNFSLSPGQFQIDAVPAVSEGMPTTVE
jgi:hypothetical protein